ncbi:MAG: hypothetical protein KF760_31735 [Candidatus Eremiobacteraeota bacterium]|nr:hypothetical protein [Candidatus Eremiobacteraeota bacterium]MCW5871465.1 hypothetical protein [Candidatus Eremiobacteraeota bacterium]
MKTIVLLLLTASVALAQPTCSGKLRAVNGDSITVEDGAGHLWTGQLTTGCQNRTSRSLDALKGRVLVYRVRGALGPTRLVELIGNLQDSAAYQTQGVNLPYFTRKGVWPSPGGVGGPPENGPNLGKLRNVPAYAPAGGFPHQNQP